MEVNILPTVPYLTPPHDPGVKVKRQLCQNMVMLHIKLKGITNTATWWQIFCPQTPYPPSLGMGSTGQTSTLSEHGHVAYRIKEFHKCNNIVANILAADPPPPPPTLLMGSVGQTSTFSEHGHVAYRIKEHHECSNMVVNMLPAVPPSPPPPTLGRGSLGLTSSYSDHGHVAYQIKGNHQMQQHGSKYFARRPLQDLWDWNIRSKVNFF